jgi:hypothetical protein
MSYSGNLVQAMTSNSAPSPNVASASDSGADAYVVFDHVVTGTGKDLIAATSGWWKLDFGSGNIYAVTKYTVLISDESGQEDRAPKDWTLQGSNNDSDWDTLDTQTTQVFANHEKKEYTFTNTTKYRYYKFDFTDNNGDAWTAVQEIEFMYTLPTSSDVLPTNLPQRANIQGFWRLDENATGGIPAFDYSGNGNHLTDVNTTTYYAGGKIAGCRDFEASNSEYLTIDDADQTGLGITGNITIAAWVKPETIPADMVIVGKWTAAAQLSYKLYIESTDSSICFGVSNNGTTDNEHNSNASAASVGTWVHVVGVYDGSYLYTYVDGLENGTPTSYSSGINDGTDVFRIGAYGGAGRPFDGLIDEVIIWNTALTATEVLAVKNITEYSYGLSQRIIMF